MVNIVFGERNEHRMNSLFLFSFSNLNLFFPSQKLSPKWPLERKMLLGHMLKWLMIKCIANFVRKFFRGVEGAFID